MSPNTECWTTRDLELYHDGELDHEKRSALGDALRRDPELRERFATVCRVDDELRAAFISEQAARHHGRRVLRPFARNVLAAACLLAAAGLTWWFASSQRPWRQTALVKDVHPGDSNTAPESEYHAIRVVLSLPVDSTLVQAVTEQGVEPLPASATTASEEVPRFLARLNHALVEGRIEDTLDLLDGASRTQRTVAYRHLGELLRSAYVAEQILDRLSPQEQLAVCSLWAHEPVVQPIVFERLRRFSREPELSNDVRSIVTKLARDPRLRPWLRGYQLGGDRPTRQTVSG